MASDDPALLAGFLLHAPAKAAAAAGGETMNSVSGLDKRLQEVLTRPEFLEMRDVAKEVPIFIQTYGPADEDQLRVKPVDLFELVHQLLEAKGYLDVVLQEEASWSRSDLFDTLQNVAEPTAALVPKLITGSGVPLPAHPHDP